ncbi:DnaJ-domain-containing protein [Saccharata proteae CBS 121410]|uniref:DnaJ-domain-containing protein n=1 Tax=Saccharata proteae CBS 121410 TaxID=1314787 RepID=A0A6A5YD11_9PEZI|nr:DnaJ-domain-containing protein [Saccharata proteae CBS 121410]
MPRNHEEELVDEEPPTSIDPYEVLGLEREATAGEVKIAYRKAALKHHPDKAEDKETAHTKFQEIAFAYAILSDPRRRSRYDTTGRTEETVDLEDDDFDWLQFYRGQFENVISEAAIDNFKSEYKGSDEEKRDLLAAYEKHKGSMNKIYEVVMLSNPLEDEDRFRAIIDGAIEDGVVDSQKKYVEETELSRQRRMDRARKEAEEAQEHSETLKTSKKGKSKAAYAPEDLGGLAAMIQQRQKGRAANFLSGLEEKYAPKDKKSKKRRTPMEEPSEEAFASNRAKKGKKRSI